MNSTLKNAEWPGMGSVSEILNEIKSKYSAPARNVRQSDEEADTPSPITSDSASVNTAFPFSEADLASYSAIAGSQPPSHANFFSEQRNAAHNIPDFPYCDAERQVYDELTGPTDDSSYSRKVFIGGLPKTLTAKELCHFFSEFGPVMIDWPHRERMPDRPPHGYAFAVFSRAASVDALIHRCSVSRGKHCIYLGPYCVQVRPWVKMDREHYMPGYDEVNSARTQRYSIFIGGVARTTTARNLAETIHDAIGDVVAVRIEVDYDTEYPKGAARVIFATEKAYVTAIARRFISMASHDLHKDEYKEVEMKPYLEDCMICERCFKMSTRSFCAELRCLKYFCDMCWKVWHSSHPSSSDHRPMLKGMHQARYTPSSASSSSESFRNRSSAPPSPFATGGAHSPPASAGPFGSATSFWQQQSAAAATAAAMAAAAVRVSTASVLRSGAAVAAAASQSASPYGAYPSLLATPSSLLYANGALSAPSLARRSGLESAAALKLADLHGVFGRELVPPPSAFGSSSSSSSLAGLAGAGMAPLSPLAGGTAGGFASASSSATTHFTFDDIYSLSPPAESPHSPRSDKQLHYKFFGF